jgi:hypothetical protein
MDSAAERGEGSATHACRNCGAHATGHFCPNCGQETRIGLPTFAAFMREAAGRYVALDGRLWRTLAALVAKPGFLTREYLNGRRRRYIRPARLFLVLYLLLFAVIGILQSPDAVNISDADKPAGETLLQKGRKPGPTVTVLEDEDTDSLFGLDKDLNLTMRFGGKEYELPAQVRRRYEHFRKLPSEEKVERLYAGMLRYGPYAMVALLPAFALLLKLAYAGRGTRYAGRPTRYAEHLVYSAHLHAFAAIMIIAFLLVPFAPARVALAAWIVFYAMRARQVVYRGRWWGGVARALVIAIFYSALLGFAMLGLLVAAVMLR